MPNFRKNSERVKTPNDDIMNEIISDLESKKNDSTIFGRKSSRNFSQIDVDSCKL